MEKGIPFINDYVTFTKEKKSRIVAWQRMSKITSRFIDLKKHQTTHSHLISATKYIFQ